DDALERGELDIVDFAGRLTVTIICRLMGIPTELAPRIRRWSADLDNTVNPVLSADVIARGHSAMGAMLECLRELIDERRRAPCGGLLAAIVQAVDADDLLGENDLLAMAVILAEAGHNSSVHMIGNAMLALLRHPDQLAALRAHPELAANAVEEL